MNSKWKKICKASMALTLVLCLSCGLFSPYLQPNEAEAAEGIDLSQYDVMSFADYGYEDGTYTSNGSGVAAYRNNLDKVYFDGYITPSETTELYLGATVVGARDGIRIQFRDGAIVVSDPSTDNSEKIYYSNKITLGAEMRLGMSVDYIDAKSDGSADDVQVGIWIDKVHLGVNTFYDMKDQLGAYLTVRVCEQTGYTVTSGGDSTHFFLGNKTATSGPITLNYTVSEISANPTTGDNTVGRNGVVAITTVATQYPFDFGSSLTNPTDNWFMLLGCTYNLELGLDAQGNVTLKGSYTNAEGQTKSLDKVSDWAQTGAAQGTRNTNYDHFGVYFSSKRTGTLANVTCVDASGNDLGVQSNQTSCVIERNSESTGIRSVNASDLYENYKEVSFADFGIASDTYSSAKVGTYDASSGTDTLDGAVLVTNLSMTKPAGFRYGGTNADGWAGARLVWNSSGELQLTYVHNDNTSTTYATFGKYVIEGVSMGTQQRVMLSTKLIDADSDGKKDDLKLGLAIGDEFYKSYIVIDANKLGNYVRLLSDGSGSITVAESLITLDECAYQRLTISDTGAEDKTDGNTEGSLGLQKWDKVLFSANLKLGTDSFFVYGAPWESGRVSAYVGMYFHVSGGVVKLKFNGISGYSTYSIPKATVGEVFNLKITTDYVDFDKDGSKDDVKLGVWVNGELNQNRYIYLLNYVQYLNNGFVFIKQNDSCAIASDILLSDVSYKLDGLGYLITTTGSAVVSRNGEDYTVTDNMLTEAGTYRIVKTEGYRTITQTVSLYEGGGSDVPAVTYDYLGGDEVMPIAGYFGPYQMNDGTYTYDYVSTNIYKMIADSGINLINHSTNDYIGNSNVVLKQLRLAEKYNLGVYVSDLKLSNTNETIIGEYTNMSGTANLANRLGEYSSYDSFLGIHLFDEPYTDDYNLLDKAIFTQHDRYQRKLDSYLGISSSLNSYVNTTAFLNLLALSSPNNTINGTVTDKDEIAVAYDAYLEKAIKDGKLKYLSYDNYLIGSANSSVDKATGYFKNLSIISEKAEEHQIPFWSYVQLGGDFSGRENTRKYAATDAAALPTEAETYWQINMPLAFGAKGIEYFTLIQPYYFSYDDTNGVDCAIYGCNTTADCDHSHDYNRCGLIGANGQPTTYYAYAQKANAQIKAVDEVLMKSTSKGVLAVGANAQANTTGLASMISIDAVPSLEGVELSASNDNGAIIGCFDYEGKDAFYVVNYDVENPQTITLKFADGETDYRVIQNTEESTGTAQEVALQIPQGEAALVVLESTEKTAQYVYYGDISAYRSTDTTKNIAPVLEGYAFAGWFKEGRNGAEAIATDVVNGGAYAKFVDEKLLNVKAQVRYYDVNAIEKMDIRFVSTVDTKTYQKVGFVLEYNDKVVNTETKVVYNNLYAWDDNTYTTYAPTDLCKAAKHFISHTLKNVPIKNFNTPTKATAYWITKDGTTVMGESVYKTIYEGIRKVTSPEAYGYTKGLTITDFGVKSSSYKTGSLERANGTYGASLENTYLDIDITLPDNKSAGADGTALYYAGNSTLNGICMYMSDGYLCIQDVQNADAKQRFDLEQYGIAAGSEFNLKLSTKLMADNATLQVGIWINDMLAGATFYKFANFSSYGSSIAAVGTSTGAITVRVPYKMKQN